REQSVAIVGAGPAGLSAAYDLALEGFQVTVFEALPVPGGMLAVGAPEFRLPREALRADIDNVTALGVRIELSRPVTNPASMIGDGYQAVIIATGSHEGTRLPIPGSELDCVWTATSLLRKVGLGARVDIGNTVLVLGGGDVALDAARTAVRLGASKVGMVCLESRETMPADPLETIRAEEEGVKIYPSRTFIRIVARSGKASGVECLELRSMEFDGAGSLHLDKIEGSEHVLPADTIVFAVGQTPDLGFLGDHSGLEVTRRGIIAVDPNTLATGVAGVFAAGDVATKAGSVAKAIADGQRAAMSVTTFLNAQESSSYAVRMDREIVPLPSEQPVVEELMGIPREKPAELAAERRKCCWTEAVLTLTPEQAAKEASRCLRCDLDRSAETMDPRRVGFAETTEEQIARIWQNGKGNYGHFLRKTLLHGLGVKRKLDRAETVIIFGCAMPFGMPRQVLSSLKILDTLGVEYTFLRDKEYCCAVPVIEMGRPQDQEKARAASSGFVKANLQAALGLGAKRVAYLCQWCVYAVSKNVPEEKVPQLYFYDLLLQPDVLAKLKQRPLRVPRTRVGYFEGCHLRNLAYAPGVEINWKRYRTLLEMVEGVEIVDIPVLKCCVIDAENIVANAMRQDLDAIVSPCAACWTWIERIGSRKDFPVRMLRDVLAEALTGQGKPGTGMWETLSRER
ncbi:MAG: FAD-dependent oxidoreductase, partial [Dehalococcoidia bacterium]|nr:FAD-dependent oxidoreductase [Dehalococcoidia bacterium]